MIRKLLLFSSLIFLITAFIPKKKKEFLPPGTVKINDTLYADKEEITNFSWYEFVFWTKQKYGAASKEYISTLPDTLVWRENGSYNEPYVVYYHKHPAYRNYPAVGISYEQAVDYCKWRTERVREYKYANKQYDLLEFEYRLPTKQEWEFLSNNGNYGNGYSVFYNKGMDEKGRPTFNHRYLDTTEIKGTKFYTADVTAPTNSYIKNHFGLYNMIGNVAEMVQEKGISKGGGWKHEFEECRVGKNIPYTKPTAWLGFRCVCIVKKSKVS